MPTEKELQEYREKVHLRVLFSSDEKTGLVYRSTEYKYDYPRGTDSKDIYKGAIIRSYCSLVNNPEHGDLIATFTRASITVTDYNKDFGLKKGFDPNEYIELSRSDVLGIMEDFLGSQRYPNNAPQVDYFSLGS